jgi:hypothetical protein
MPELVPVHRRRNRRRRLLVRILAANGSAWSVPSNEVLVHIRAGCYTPGAPTNFTQIVRGTLGFLAWNAGNGGQATTYTVRASFVPNDPNPPIQLPLTALAFTLGIPPGSYYVNIVASNACGVSAPSNELLVTAPAIRPRARPIRRPANACRCPMRGMVFQFANEAIGRAAQPGHPCPTRVAGPYRLRAARSAQDAAQRLIDYIVSRLRQIDTRFGYNAKPTRLGAVDHRRGRNRHHYGRRLKARRTPTRSTCSAGTAPASVAFPARTVTRRTTGRSSTSSSAGRAPAPSRPPTSLRVASGTESYACIVGSGTGGRRGHDRGMQRCRQRPDVAVGGSGR